MSKKVTGDAGTGEETATLKTTKASQKLPGDGSPDMAKPDQTHQIRQYRQRRALCHRRHVRRRYTRRSPEDGVIGRRACG